ncbi:hypothetical protein GGE12_005529 [Rhizobium mongolense]|uniref:Methyl-accepting chemotaxis protein n=1 Tax=Rhizobium mongolense TaxID=57676 RepID=A0A7W6RSA6_9HYPH|nr:hypothetical protein [Rhizobium mongolense]
MNEVSAGVRLYTGRLRRRGTVALISNQLGAIATSANERSIARAEIDSADHVTQQNASMAEVCTSASTSLVTQVRRRRQIVSEFSLDPYQERSTRPMLTSLESNVSWH